MNGSLGEREIAVGTRAHEGRVFPRYFEFSAQTPTSVSITSYMETR